MDGLASPRRPMWALQRRGYSVRTYERSRDVVFGRVIFKVQGDEKLGFRRFPLFSRRRRRSRMC